MKYRHQQQTPRTARTPPNCPGGSTNLIDKINDDLPFLTTFAPAWENLTHPALPLSDKKSQYLPGAGFKAVQILPSAFLLKQSHPCTTDSNSKTVLTHNCAGHDALPSRSYPASDHSHLPAPSCSCVDTVHYRTRASSHSGQETRKPRWTEMLPSVGKEISYLLQKSGSTFLPNKLRQFYPPSSCSKMSD